MRGERRRRRVWLFAALLPIAAGVAWLVVHIAAADLLAATDPAAALRWWPGHTAAQFQLARKTPPAPDQEANARDILQRNPFEGEAYLLVAESRERAGDTANAAMLYAIGSQHAPRNRRAHAWLADHYARQGDYALMLGQVDELMRMLIRGHGQMFPSVGALVADPASRAILVQFLGDQAPPWREEFLRWFAAQAEVGDAVSAVLHPLRTAAVPLTTMERQFWTERLMRDGRAGEAYILWVDGLEPERRTSVGNVYDGGFELPPEDGGFGWQFKRVAGASIRQEPTQGAIDKQALVVEFHDQRVAFEHVRQQLALPAGKYRFSGRVRLDNLRNERGLQWRLHCANSSELASTSAFSGSSDWREFGLEMEVPKLDCAIQTLQLRLDARIRPEQLIGGRIWFDDLRIVRLH